MKTPSQVRSLELDTSCPLITIDKWDELMKGSVRADKRKIDKLVKEHLPELFEDLCLNFCNPYNYFKTDKHLILVHSAIEYFLRYKI